jgi:sugar O-acyltransferase (sialic acid O-acetyltransferase NeuD family)
MPSKENLIIIGAANPHIIRLVEDINDSGKRNLQIVGFLDNRFKELGKDFYGHTIIGGFESITKFRKEDILIINTIAGKMEIREETTKCFLDKGWNFTNLIHPTINIGHVTLGTGNILYENALIQPYVKIGNHCVFSSNSGVGHESVIHDFCFVGPASYICGKVTVGKRVYIAVGAKILPRLIIEDGAFIAAGSLVVKNVGRGQKC